MHCCLLRRSSIKVFPTTLGGNSGVHTFKAVVINKMTCMHSIRKTHRSKIKLAAKENDKPEPENDINI